jgi:hypothetical protein
MRQQNWRHPVEKGSPWVLSDAQIAQLTTRFTAAADPAHPDVVAVPAAEGVFATRTVGELLDTYSDVLSELRSRGLVRTNNAPIGDLAEFCAAVVYDGLLAPNSERSYDLTAADGRKVQVKVRLIRTATSPSAVFSPIRSFDFDVCAFILIDNDSGRVAVAREWTAAEVREHGRHREHTNGTVVRIGQMRSSNAIGLEKTGEFDAAWRDLLSQRR